MTDISTSGDEDQWMLLERQSLEGLPMLVRSRTGNPAIASFEDKNQVSAVILDIKPDYVRDNGFPRNLDDIHELEDRILNELDVLHADCIHTASVTGDARRTMYIAHDKSAQLEQIVKSLSVDFGELQVVSDIEIEVYREFVMPSVLDKQLDGDRGVITALEGHGDIGTVERKIDFWFYGERIALDSLLADLSDIGLQLDHWIDDPVGIVVTAEIPATTDHFRQLTPLLIDLSTKHDVSYDGWETFIVKMDDDTVSAPEPEKRKSLLKKLFGQKKN
jgi:hypothetical protein